MPRAPLVAILPASGFAIFGAIAACGSDGAGFSDDAGSTDDARWTADSGFEGRAPDDATFAPRCVVDAAPGSGEIDKGESYWGRCSPTCGEGQFCFSYGASPLEFGPDAADDRPASNNWMHARPLYCDGCHPMPACDGADPCACLLATLPEDVCDGAPVQCRVLESGPQFRCRAFPFE